MKPLRCPKCRGTKMEIAQRFMTKRGTAISGWWVMCNTSGSCAWEVFVPRREIVGTAILRWLAKDGGHIR